ncbi:acid phosphatase/Vanadium-dependent haloperoxidase [Hypoxylon trugodes]|uniref:acid phosphatase/Vanadium-dependent haloperoxidase n=1 Tax=Hypoxylon trugodes TaxID=326681 RepID=UPI00218EB6C7|nr:acid phosphatase/Vanadium-dependent haloperoxidase [Hypoxylon trugodes]KAI1386958.1 acid phosphatase/Vanadium-dependent haloperoxidase [Hypoxylon trugodes]
MPEDDHNFQTLNSVSPLLAHPYSKMPEHSSPPFQTLQSSKFKPSLVVVGSYAFDWIILIVVGVIGVVLGNITPNKRPFSLQDPNISFPFTQHETVTSAILLICNAVIPIVIILIVVLLFVPGPTVPEGTPRALIWRRKLWELHTGWLGLALALISAWIITQGMKNLFGKPRPDLLSRCQPDIANVANYIIGFHTPADDGTLDGAYNGQLVSADICKNPDRGLLDDGFRSYPSGHASSAAAGLIYLSFFLASKFAITFPFVPQHSSGNTGVVTAFPSRLRNGAIDTSYEAVRNNLDLDRSVSPDPSAVKQIGAHTSTVLSIRRQAAAPPLYLLLLTVLPFFTAIFIASSRWFDFRHHGFDILFGFIIGTITAYFAFRYYHLPIRAGAGWAWGPRSHDKAFWAGLGSWSYATDRKHWVKAGDEAERMPGQRAEDIEMGVRFRSKADDHLRAESSGTTAIGEERV